MNVVVADIHFRISSEDLPLLQLPDRKTYWPFISDAIHSGEGVERVDVRLELQDFPDARQLTKIFETPDAWSMFREGDHYFWMDIPASSGGNPDCVVRFKRRPEQVTVYCGESYLTEVSGEKTLLNPISYPLDQLLLMYVLAAREGACLHATAFDVHGKGYLFPGRSGAGKSTISRIFAAPNRTVLSDDRVVVRKIGDSFRCYGTPWAGEAEIAENRNLPLHGIFFIVHGDENRIDKITPAAAFEKLMPVTSIPWYDEKVMPDILSFCEDLVLNVPAYDLHFKPDIEVVDFLETFIPE